MDTNKPIRINLLDWRERRRTQRCRLFFIAFTTVTVLCSVMIAATALYVRGTEIQPQQQHNAELRHRVATAQSRNAQANETQDQLADTTAQLQSLRHLQQTRTGNRRYIKQIAQARPSGVVLTALNRKGGLTTLTGRAQSNAQVSLYMTNLTTTGDFEQPHLTVIKTAQNRGRHAAVFTFTIQSVDTRAASATNPQ